ncbi:MAG: hypothetical protein JWO53_308 [Chlamydiia bacterium]|nr:hypothetical protein [Chlamydiia bacterium]
MRGNAVTTQLSSEMSCLNAQLQEMDQLLNQAQANRVDAKGYALVANRRVIAINNRIHSLMNSMHSGYSIDESSCEMIHERIGQIRNVNKEIERTSWKTTYWVMKWLLCLPRAFGLYHAGLEIDGKSLEGIMQRYAIQKKAAIFGRKEKESLSH